MVRKDPQPVNDEGDWDEFDGGWTTPQAEEAQETAVDSDESPAPLQRNRSSSSLRRKQDENERHDVAVAEAAQRMTLMKMGDFEPERGRDDAQAAAQVRAPQRSGSTSHSSDGTASSLDHSHHGNAHSADGAIHPDQLSRYASSTARSPRRLEHCARLLAPGEAVAHAARVHIRRDVLGGLMHKDRAVTLCLTSSARLLALHAARKGWRTEAVLAFAGAEERVAETDGTVVGVDVSPGETLFTLRTVRVALLVTTLI